MHEIITLQFGQQANYLATHFWNTQESYFTYSDDEESPVDHDIHFRPGIAPDGTETFMPRTVIYDLKDSFGTLRQVNALYDVNDDSGPPQALWNTPATPLLLPSQESQLKPQSQQQTPLHPYIEALTSGSAPPQRPLTSSIRFFSDYSRVFYHPRSLVPLASPAQDLVHDAAFARHATGEELFAALDRDLQHDSLGSGNTSGGGDLLDRDLRRFAEEADCLQGVQVLTGVDDAWGGFAGRYVERVRDEYGKCAVWVWGLQRGVGGGVSRENRLLRLANKARTLAELYQHASIVVPLAVPAWLPATVQLDPAAHWHTSALLAAALESAMLPARLKDPARRETLGGMAELLNTMGKQTVAGLQMSFARGEESGSRVDARQRKLSEEELSEGVRLDIGFTPSDQLEPHARSNGFSRPRVFSQLIASRGYGDEEPDDVEIDEQGRRVRRSPYDPVIKSYNSALQFPILDSFPEIFRDDDGEALADHINITSSLATDSSVSSRLKQLRSTVIRSIGLEDRETLGNDLMEMADEYHEGWSSGSDDGEDD